MTSTLPNFEPFLGRSLATAPSSNLAAPASGKATAVQAWFDELAAASGPAQDGSLQAARESARANQSRAKARNTRAAYRSAVRKWCAWCDKRGLPALPGASCDVAAFISDESEGRLAATTIRLRVAAIRYLHRAAGLPSPTATAEVSETVAGIVNSRAAPRKKRAATLTVLRELLVPIPDDLRGHRDRALLLVGFAGALRRSELAAIRLADLQRTDRGYELTLPRSKGSQAKPVLVPLPYGKTELCPVHALMRWIAAAGVTDGPVFRRIWLPPSPEADGSHPTSAVGAEALTPRSIARIIQSRAAGAGFIPGDFGGHSLKRGALTTGMQRGAHPAQLKRLGRHKGFGVLGEYLEHGDLFDGHPLTEAL